MSASGGDAQRLTVGARVTKDPPLWSPDGSRIVFQIADGENYDIGVTQVSATTRSFAVLAGSQAYDGSYTWSPDGRHVAFISARDGFEGVYVANVYSQVVVQLTDSASLTPAWGSQR